MSNMSKVFEFEQQQFISEFTNTKIEAAKADQEFKKFRSIAYMLKAVAIFGSIAIAAGLPERAAQFVGVMIMVAVGVDALLSNQKRAIANALARVSYRAVLETAIFNHTNALSDELPKRESDEDAFFLAMTAKLKKLREELFQSRRDVVQALEKAELAALESLKVEAKER